MSIPESNGSTIACGLHYNGVKGSHRLLHLPTSLVTLSKSLLLLRGVLLLLVPVVVLLLLWCCLKFHLLLL